MRADIPFYEIRVAGHLNSRWSAWFDGLSITNMEGGEAILAGRVEDQSALHGILDRLRDLGIDLLSVERKEI